MTDPRPCPFCGGIGKPVKQHWANRDFHGVSCDGDCSTFFDCRAKTEADAVGQWNARAQEPGTVTVPAEPNDEMLLRFMYEVHSNVPEAQRPISFSAFSDDQWSRLRAAYAAMLAAAPRAIWAEAARVG